MKEIYKYSIFIRKIKVFGPERPFIHTTYKSSKCTNLYPTNNGNIIGIQQAVKSKIKKSDRNAIQIHNHLIRNRTLNHS